MASTGDFERSTTFDHDVLGVELGVVLSSLDMNENSRSPAALLVIDGTETAPDVARAAEARFANELTWAVVAVVAQHPRLTRGQPASPAPS